MRLLQLLRRCWSCVRWILDMSDILTCLRFISHCLPQPQCPIQFLPAPEASRLVVCCPAFMPTQLVTQSRIVSHLKSPQLRKVAGSGSLASSALARGLCLTFLRAPGCFELLQSTAHILIPSFSRTVMRCWSFSGAERNCSSLFR